MEQLPNNQHFLEKLPVTLFSYRLNPHTGTMEFECLNQGIIPLLFPEQSIQHQSQAFDLLSQAQQNIIKEAMQSAPSSGDEWSCTLEIGLNDLKWVEFSGRTEHSSHETLSGQGFAALASEKIRELEQSREKLASLNRLHDLIINFSTMLVQARLEEVDSAVNTTLSRLGEYTEVDRVYIFEYEPYADVVNNTYEWCAAGISPEIDNLQGIPFEAVPRWKEKFSRNEYVYIPSVSEIDEEYRVEKEILEPQGIVSLLALPLYYGDKLYGFIGFDSVRRQREWSVEHINLLRLAGDIIAGTLNRAKFENEIIAARKEAEEANRAKSEFLATMSHEIRTPMNAILGFSEILHNSISDPKNKQYISAILGSGRTLLALINDILDLSKIESGQMHIAEEPVDIQGLVYEIVHLFQPKTTEKNIYLHLESPLEFPSALLTDEVRLRQVLFNLVGNAVKFTQEGGVIIALEAVQQSETNLYDLYIKVHDTGIGIESDKLERIFQLFYQVESDITRKYGGTGLGLAISQKLVELMGGTISVKSELGKGSSFIIFLPALEASSLTTTQHEQHDWETQNIVFEEAMVLIVDDVDYNRELIKKYFESDKLQIMQAINGRQGVEICRQYKPSVVLMDLRMPEMNGYEATEVLKSDPQTASIPVIAFTASSMKHDEEKIRKLFDGYVRKPVTRNEVIKALKTFLPHQTLDSSAEPLPKDFINELEVGQISQFLDTFDPTLAPIIVQLRTFVDPEVAGIFARDLVFLIRQYGIKSLIELSNQMQVAIENFDFGKFDVLLNQLDKELQHLRTILN